MTEVTGVSAPGEAGSRSAAVSKDPAPRRPAGRRPGSTVSRQAILEAAESMFAKYGYGSASIRGIAQEAGVDAALVRHFFVSKEGLFAAVMHDVMQPGHLVAAVTGGPPPSGGGEPPDGAQPRQPAGRQGMGVRLVSGFLSLWEGETTGGKMLGLLRSAVTHEEAERMLRDFLTSEVVTPIARAIGTPHPEMRATFAGSQLIGLAMIRYVVKVQPLASLERQAVVSVVGPTVEHYLSGALPPLPEA